MVHDSQVRPDADMDGILDASEDAPMRAETYAEQISTQLRKGFLAYCVLKVCAQQPKYTSDIIAALREAEMVVVEGTIYPLLSRLQKDGLLVHEWQESEQGPPRKYYKTTDYGNDIMAYVSARITDLNATLKKI
jgi:PadR family transcriptional regulator PadR